MNGAQSLLKNGHDFTATAHMCMPTLSVINLLVLLLSVKRNCVILYYDILPRYLRGVIRVLRIPEEKIISVLSSFSGMSIQKVKRGDEVPGYRDLHLKAQETTSVIAEQLIPLLEKSKWVLQMEKLIGRNPAIAYSVKQIANNQIFPQILPIIACYLNVAEKTHYIAVWDYCCPEEWLDVIKNHLKDVDFKFFKWPKWYVSASKFFFTISFLPVLFIVSLTYIIKRGVVLRKIVKKKHYKIITEFIDPEKFSNNTPYDADYWIDGKTVKAEDVLFFLTGQQRKVLVRNGYNIKNLLENASYRGYEIKNLDNFAYPLEIIKKTHLIILSLLKCFACDGTLLSGNIFLKAWSEYMNFFPLFAHCHAENFIYLTFPNGRTGLRYNSGIVTGLCRSCGILSVGCQTRAVHSKNYEYSFDCFDVHLAWGKIWYEMLGEGMRFIDKVIIVGCIYLDYLLPAYRESRDRLTEKAHQGKLKVCIFPTDIDPKHHYTLNYALSFMKSCARLAIAHRDIRFVIKSKEPEYTKIILRDSEFMNLYIKAKDNFMFLDRPRYDYADLLFSRDIFIAVGFTTPGMEALLLGKRAIYYNELSYGGTAYRNLSQLVASSEESLNILFEQAIQDYDSYAKMNSVNLDTLDPFRDGEARRRIYKEILGVTG